MKKNNNLKFYGSHKKLLSIDMAQDTLYYKVILKFNFLEKNKSGEHPA